MLESVFVTPPTPAVSESFPSEAARAKTSTSVTSIGLVFLCTVTGAAAQLLMKTGTERLPPGGLGSIFTHLPLLLSNLPLIAGFVLYGLNTFLLVTALRQGHLSVLYPIIALTYVWVTILSPMFFPDHLNPFKVGGVALIVLGVSLIGMGSRE